MGIIYKIINSINNKAYIGQTSTTLKKRINDHIKNMELPNRYDYALYRALRKYGINNFKLEIIEECVDDKLDEREIYWIDYYDTYNSGYNMTLGGGGGKKYNFNEKEIINKYKNGESIRKISSDLNVSTIVISSILHKNNIDITTLEDNTQVGLIQLDTDFNVVNTFECKNDAYKWMLRNRTKELPRSTFYYYCKKAYEENKVYQGYYWIEASKDIAEEIKLIKQRNANKYSQYVESSRCSASNINGKIEFNKYADAADWLLKIGATTARKYYITNRIKTAAINNTELYGFYWETIK